MLVAEVMALIGSEATHNARRWLSFRLLIVQERLKQ
jgi:hypothetical protein